MLMGKANTRFSDFRDFCYQTGPNAFAIISLTSLLVGMILAYLGAAQLQQFGAEIYVADLLGIVGGGIVAGGMGISPIQYITQSESALSFTHVAVGLMKSVVFATLIAVAGCRSGINSGRSSAAVGQAATEAVVTAIVYLIVADATINIFFQQVGI